MGGPFSPGLPAGGRRAAESFPPLTGKQYSTGTVFGQKKLVMEEDILYSKDLRRSMKSICGLEKWNGKETERRSDLDPQCPWL
jgi:hypothetical protein